MAVLRGDAGRPGGAPRGRTPVQLEIRAPDGRAAEEPARRDVAPAPDPMDDLPSDDDPDIVATGLVGTALVVNLLDGTIIEAIHEQGA